MLQRWSIWDLSLGDISINGSFETSNSRETDEVPWILWTWQINQETYLSAPWLPMWTQDMQLRSQSFDLYMKSTIPLGIHFTLPQSGQ